MAHDRNIFFLDAQRENKWLRISIGDLEPGFRLNTAGFCGFHRLNTDSH